MYYTKYEKRQINETFFSLLKMLSKMAYNLNGSELYIIICLLNHQIIN